MTCVLITSSPGSTPQRLWAKYVPRWLHVQPGSDVHDAGLEWSLASIDWHRFADVNPSSVDALYLR